MTMSQTSTPDAKPVNPLPDTLKKATDYYLRMREAHTVNAGELDNIDTAIARAKEQKANTESFPIPTGVRVFLRRVAK